MVSVFLRKFQIGYVLILLVFLNSCGNRHPKPQPITFDFQHEEYWIMENIEWETLSEETEASTSNIILFRNKDANWGIIFFGSLTKHKNIIMINQESGYDITYTQIGPVKMGDSVFVEKELFLRINDAVIEYGGNRFVRSKLPVISGFELIERE